MIDWDLRRERKWFGDGMKRDNDNRDGGDIQSECSFVFMSASCCESRGNVVKEAL